MLIKFRNKQCSLASIRSWTKFFAAWSGHSGSAEPPGLTLQTPSVLGAYLEVGKEQGEATSMLGPIRDLKGWLLPWRFLLTFRPE